LRKAHTHRVGAFDSGEAGPGLDPYKARIALMLALGAGLSAPELPPLLQTLSYA